MGATTNRHCQRLTSGQGCHLQALLSQPSPVAPDRGYPVTDRMQRRAEEAVEGEALLPEALEKLSTALDELRASEEEVRVQNEQLAEGWQTVEAEREHYRELFEFAPTAYLVTDRVGVIREANRRAASLLGVAQRFLVGRPLAMFVAAEDRWEAARPAQPAGRPRPRQLAAAAAAAQAGPSPGDGVDQRSPGPGWRSDRAALAVLELPPASDDITQEPATAPAGATASMPAELASSRPAADPVLTVVPSSALDWANLADARQRVMQTAVPLLGPMRPG